MTIADPGIQLAVIVVCYRSNSLIQGCVDALDATLTAMPPDSRPGVDLVLVANSPEDHIEGVRSRECRLTLLRTTDNVGFSPAVNMGLEAVPDANFVLLLNPDALLDRDCLAILLAECTSRRAAVVGPILCDETGHPHGVSERPFHSVHREIATQLLGAERRRPPYGRRAYQTGEARCLTGACLLVEGAFLRAVGGMDTEVRMYLEDVMLCWHAHRRQRAVILAVRARCRHALGQSAEGANFASSLGLRLTLLGARVTFVRRTSGAVHAALVRMAVVAGAALRIALARGPKRQMHLAVLRWAIRSGSPPRWENGPLVDVEIR